MSTASRERRKVFGIGLSKTGTSSLTKALEMLGYRSAHFIAPERIAEYDAVCDTPIPVRYRELDSAFPGSRFILTVRSQNGWLESFRDHHESWGIPERLDELEGELGEIVRACHRQLYGTVEFNVTMMKQGYSRHVAAVSEYFRDRPDDLLIMDIVGGDGWDVLCPFLGRAIPAVPFPHCNRAARYREEEVRSPGSRSVGFFRNLARRVPGASALAAAVREAGGAVGFGETRMTVAGVRVRFSTRDSYSRSWFAARCPGGAVHEPRVVEHLCRRLIRSRCFVDVGAHLGYYSCLAGRLMKGGDVVAFELDEANFERAKKNFRLNGIPLSGLFRAAVCDRDGKVAYRGSGRPSPMHSIAGVEVSDRATGTGRLELPAITLDRFFETRDLRPDVLKIDVEGAEARILSGMETLLREAKPELYIEVHPVELQRFGDEAPEVVSQLRSFGYRIWEIEDFRCEAAGRCLREVSELKGADEIVMLYASAGRRGCES